MSNRLVLALVMFVLQAAAISLGEERKGKAPSEAAAEAPQKIPIADLRRTLPVNFESEVLPLLAKNCLACHKSVDPENGLVLESPESIRKGGEHGPAVVPGQSGQSRLLQLASHEKNPIMPPADNKVAAAALSPEQLGLIKAWIDQGRKVLSARSPAWCRASRFPRRRIRSWRWRSRPTTTTWHAAAAIGWQFTICAAREWSLNWSILHWSQAVGPGRRTKI